MDQQLDEIAKELEDPEMVDRKFSDRIAKHFDDIGLTANELSLGRIGLTLPMCLCFTLASVLSDQFLYWLFWMFSGTLLYVVGMLTDFVDGALARYQQTKYSLTERSEEDEYRLTFWERIKIHGKSHYGAVVLDPAADKIMYFGAIFPLGLDVVEHVILFGSLLIALLLTLIRIGAIRRALSFGGKGASNRMGKIKIWIEIAAVACLVLIPAGSYKSMSANSVIGLAMLIGLLSLASHIFLALRKATALRKRKSLHVIH